MTRWGIALIVAFVVIGLAEITYLFTRGVQYVIDSSTGQTQVFVGGEVAWLVGAGVLVIALVAAGFARSVVRKNRSTRRDFS